MSLEAMKALAGTNSRQIAETLSGDINKHRDTIKLLKGMAGVDQAALGNYAGSVDRLDQLLQISRSENLGEAGSEISHNERAMLGAASAEAAKAGTADFKVKLEDASTVTGSGKVSGDPAKTTTDTLIRNQGESVWRHAGTGERVGEAVDGTVAKENESRRMTKAEGESVWRDEKTGKPVVDVSAAAVKRAAAEPTGGKSAVASSEARAEAYEKSGGKAYNQAWSAEEMAAGGKTLFEGDKGEGVKELQNRLIAAGYDVGPKGADGFYGPDTQKAVEAYKKKQGVPDSSTKGIGVDSSDFAKLGGKASTGGTSGASTSGRLADALESGDSTRINSLLGKMSKSELEAARKEIGGSKFDALIGKVDTTNKGDRAGSIDTDYRDSLRAAAKGERRTLDAEGARAFARNLKDADVDDNPLAKGLSWISGGSWSPGTNEAVVDRLHSLDNKSLKAVDAELRDLGYTDGLRGFVKDNYGSGDSSLKTRDLFLQRFDAAGI